MEASQSPELSTCEMTKGPVGKALEHLDFRGNLMYTGPMENKKTTRTAEEMVSIPHTEYEALCAENAMLKEYNAEIERKLKWLTEQLVLGKHGKYSFTSEQQEQLVLEGFGRTMNEAELFADAAAPELPPEEELETVSEHKRRKRSGTVTDIVPEDTPVVVVEHRLEGEELVCPKCGEAMVEIGKEVRKTLVIEPARFEIREDHYYTYACPRCKEENTEVPIVEAPKDRPLISGSFASPEAVAYLMTQKYVMGSPIYRMERDFLRKDIFLSRQTMSNWMLRCAADYLEPIYEELRQQLICRDVLHADETTLQVLREPGKKAQTKSYMWLYRTSGDAEQPIVLYDYKPNRKIENAEGFLGAFRGYLHADGYPGYHSLPEGITVVGCLAHARRKFADALKVLPMEQRRNSSPAEALRYFARIAAWEKKLEGASPKERYTKRLEKEKPILDALFAWADTRKNVAPKSMLGKALYYLREQRPYLERYLLDGRLESTNNRAERSIKPFVIGRKNFLFANTPEGAQGSAVIFSLIETAKENHLDPYAYLLYIFRTAPGLDRTIRGWAQPLLPENVPEICRARN